MITWEWNKKIGKVTYTHGRTDNLYKGNAQIIAVHEDERHNDYFVSWFSADKNHLRNMLGLEKSYEGCISENRLFDIESIELDTKYKGVPDIVKDFARAKVDITIKLYNSDEIPFEL